MGRNTQELGYEVYSLENHNTDTSALSSPTFTPPPTLRRWKGPWLFQLALIMIACIKITLSVQSDTGLRSGTEYFPLR